MRTIRHPKGFLALGTIVTICILSVMGVVITVMIGTNQSTRTNQLNADQAYYSANAALEFANKQILVDGNPTPIPARSLLGSPLVITRNGGRLAATGTKGSATASFSVVDKGSMSCIYILNPNASGALNMVSSGGLLKSTSCSANVNSTSSSAVNIVGNGIINMSAVNIVGGYNIVGSGSILTKSGNVNTGAMALADPLLAYNVPAYSTCNYTNKSIVGGGATTLNPGTYCGGISIVASGADVTMNPGIYIIDGSSFSFTGTGNITANNVTIILSGKISGTYAKLNYVSSGGNFTLTAPSSGTYSGIAIFQDRNAPVGVSNSMVGSANLNVSGAVYLPNQTLTYVGGGSSTAPCTLLIVNKLSITGSTNINCPAGTSFPFL